MKRLLLTLTLIVAALTAALSSELNCKVEVNVSRTETMPADVARQLQEAIAEYVNTTSFTELRIAPAERIECRMFLDVTSYADEKVSGTLTVQSTRPVYDSTYTTTLLNFKDSDISFAYSPGQQLVFARDAIDSPLTALLDFYVYLIMGLDFDSFGADGGSPFYEAAAQIVSLARTTGEKGWRAIDDNRCRAALLAALTDQPTAACRRMLYDYHRRGLDEMSMSPDKGRATITQALETLRKVLQTAPMSVALSMWRDAKLDELINVYSKGSQSERDQVYDLLMQLYPTEQIRLNDIKNPPPVR